MIGLISEVVMPGLSHTRINFTPPLSLTFSVSLPECQCEDGSLPICQVVSQQKAASKTQVDLSNQVLAWRKKKWANSVKSAFSSFSLRGKCWSRFQTAAPTVAVLSIHAVCVTQAWHYCFHKPIFIRILRCTSEKLMETAKFDETSSTAQKKFLCSLDMFFAFVVRAGCMWSLKMY